MKTFEIFVAYFERGGMKEEFVAEVEGEEKEDVEGSVKVTVHEKGKGWE